MSAKAGTIFFMPKIAVYWGPGGEKSVPQGQKQAVCQVLGVPP